MLGWSLGYCGFWSEPLKSLLPTCWFASDKFANAVEFAANAVPKYCTVSQYVASDV